jgi:type VI secretion system protein ImpA
VDSGAAAPSASAILQPATSVAAIRSAPEASAALAAVASYFAISEPSSLALLLVRQAQQLVGRSFHEVIQTLVPNHAEQASVRIGIDVLFEIPVDRLAGVAANETDENGSQDMTFVGAADSAAAPENAGFSPDEMPASNHVSSTDEHGIAMQSPSKVRTRSEAIALLEQVSAFYRVNEPASPVPLLVDRACTVAQKDFVSLLRDVLPGLTISSD